MVLPVIEEHVVITRAVVDGGRVHVRKWVIEREQQANVKLQHDEVHVEHVDFAVFKEVNIEIIESAERAVVAKEARVVEEVTLEKEVTEREATIHDTVRQTEVDVGRLNENQTRRGLNNDERLL